MKAQTLDKLTNKLYEGNSGISLNIKPEHGNLGFFRKYFGEIGRYMKKRARIGLVTLIFAGGVKEAMAATYYVNPTKTIQSSIDNFADEAMIENNRLSWANDQSNIQYPSIQAAIDAAANGDTIILGRGIFTGYGNRDIDFSGKAITVRSTDPNDSNIVATTIIDCNGTETEPHRGFYFRSGEDANSILAGITIINGYASGSWPANGGGAIYCSSSPTFVNCIFNNNSAILGGGMNNEHYSNPTLTNCIFNNNSARRGGGMENNDRSNSILTNCIFNNNSAIRGGGMYNDSSNSTLTNCIFNNNSATWGGGMNNDGGNSTLTNCIFNNNSATWGGGMNNEYSNPTSTNCIFSGNSANKGGGMYNTDYSSPTLTNCIFSDNLANIGRGMYNDDRSNPTLTNCILWDGGNEIWNHESTITIIYSNIQGGWPGTGNINADPLFVDPNSNDYHLKSQAGRWDPNTKTWVIDDKTSPCIDAGDPMSPIMYEPFPNGGIINPGAYGGTPEASKTYFGLPLCETIVAGDINGDCKVNFIDFAFIARNWLRVIDSNHYLPPGE